MLRKYELTARSRDDLIPSPEFIVVGRHNLTKDHSVTFRLKKKDFNDFNKAYKNGCVIIDSIKYLPDGSDITTQYIEAVAFRATADATLLSITFTENIDVEESSATAGLFTVKQEKPMFVDGEVVNQVTEYEVSLISVDDDTVTLTVDYVYSPLPASDAVFTVSYEPTDEAYLIGTDGEKVKAFVIPFSVTTDEGPWPQAAFSYCMAQEIIVSFFGAIANETIDKTMFSANQDGEDLPIASIGKIGTRYLRIATSGNILPAAERVEVVYTPPGDGIADLRNADDYRTRAFTTDVANKSGVAPAIEEDKVLVTNKQMTIRFDQLLDGTCMPLTTDSAISVTIDGVAATITDIGLDEGGEWLVIAFTEDVADEAVVTVSYDPTAIAEAARKLQNFDGEFVAALTNTPAEVIR